MRAAAHFRAAAVTAATATLRLRRSQWRRQNPSGSQLLGFETLTEAIAIIASSALSIWPRGQRFCMIRLRKPIIKTARAEASVMSRRSSGSHDGCLTWSMPCSNQARPTIVRSSSMPSNGAGSRRHTGHAATRNKALSTPDQGNLTRRSRSSK